MSLTTELDDSGSSTRRFLEERFPNTRRVTGEANALLPALGDAGHRVRLPGALGSDLVVLRRFQGRTQRYTGTDLIRALSPEPRQRDVIVPPELATDFFASLDETLARTGPEGRLLEPGDEELLARYWIVLALFEEFERHGATRAYEWSPLLGVGSAPTVDGLLGVTKAIIEKVRGLYQLIGYTLLDYGDEYGIEKLGFYMARQGQVIEWPVADLFERLTGQGSPSIQELRQEFRDRITGLR